LSFNVTKFITLEHNPETEFRDRSGNNFSLYAGCPDHTSIVRPATGCNCLYFPQTLATNIRKTTDLSRPPFSIFHPICYSLYHAMVHCLDLLISSLKSIIRLGNVCRPEKCFRLRSAICFLDFKLKIF
jgi:hypothetical protein